jgi:hypothetical protein
VLTAVQVPVAFDSVRGPLSHWYFVPQLVIHGSVLVLAGIAFGWPGGLSGHPRHDRPVCPRQRASSGTLASLDWY